MPREFEKDVEFPEREVGARGYACRGAGEVFTRWVTDGLFECRADGVQGRAGVDGTAEFGVDGEEM